MTVSSLLNWIKQADVDEAADPLDQQVAPREVVRGVVDVAERGPQVLPGGVELLPGDPHRPLVDRDRPHGGLLPAGRAPKPAVVKL